MNVLVVNSVHGENHADFSHDLVNYLTSVSLIERSHYQEM